MLSRRTMLIIGAVLIGFVGYSHAAERTVRRDELPAAVQKAADAQSKGATVKRYVRDNESGRPEYEVEMTVDGHSKDVSIAPDGTVLEVEEQVALEALSSDVRQSLQDKAKGGTITKVESITKSGKIVAYEAQVRTAGKHREIQVGPDGKALDHEE